MISIHESELTHAISLGVRGISDFVGEYEAQLLEDIRPMARGYSDEFILDNIHSQVMTELRKRKIGGK